MSKSFPHCFALYANRGSVTAPAGFFAADLATFSRKATSSFGRATCSHGRSFLTTAAPRRPLPTIATDDIVPTASAIKPLARPAELAEAACSYFPKTLNAHRTLLCACRRCFAAGRGSGPAESAGRGSGPPRRLYHRSSSELELTLAQLPNPGKQKKARPDPDCIYKHG